MKQTLVMMSTLIGTMATDQVAAEQGRILESAWGGTGPASSGKCHFKTLAAIFPETQNMVFSEDQENKWANQNEETDWAKPPTGTYTNALMYGQYVRKFVVADTNPLYDEATLADPSYKYYVRGYDANNDDEWIHLTNERAGSSGETEAFAYEKFTLRAPSYTCVDGTETGTSDNILHAQNDMMNTGLAADSFDYVRQERCLTVTYGMQEQIPARDWLIGAASTCSENLHDDTGGRGDKEDIFVWAKYTFPAFSYQVDKLDDETSVTMNLADENEEILLVYGNEAIDSTVAIERTYFTTLDLDVGDTEAECNVAISWATQMAGVDESSSTTAATAPYECYVADASTTNAVPNTIDSECKAGSVMTCTVSKIGATSARSATYGVTLDTKVAVLEMVKLHEDTKAFPYDSMEAFLDDHEEGSGGNPDQFTTTSWYLPGSETTDTADPYTVLSYRAVSTGFTCPLESDRTQCYCDDGDCSDEVADDQSVKETRSNLGTNVELLRSNWPSDSNDVEYPIVYISMIASASLTFVDDPTVEHNDQRASNADATPADLVQDTGTFSGDYEDLRDTVATKRTAVATAQTAKAAADATAAEKNAEYNIAVADEAAATAVADQCILNEGVANCGAATTAQCVADCGALTIAEAAEAAADTAKQAADTAAANAANSLTAAEDELTTAVTAMNAYATHLNHGDATSTRRLRASEPAVHSKTVIVGQQFGKFKKH